MISVTCVYDDQKLSVGEQEEMADMDFDMRREEIKQFYKSIEEEEKC